MERIVYKNLNEDRGIVASATDEEALNELEQISIRALASYTACEYGVNEDLVATIIADRFGVKVINQLRRTDYDDVVRYLVEMNVKEIIN